MHHSFVFLALASVCFCKTPKAPKTTGPKPLTTPTLSGCYSNEEYSSFGLDSGASSASENSRLCGDIHSEFGSCVNERSIPAFYEALRSTVAKTYADNLMSLSKSADSFYNKTHEIYTRLNSSSTVSQEALSRLNASLTEFGTAADFAAEAKDLIEEENCIAVQASLTLTSMCLLTAKNVSQPYFSSLEGSVEAPAGRRQLNVRRPIAEIVVGACERNLELTCKLVGLIDGVSAFAGETFLSRELVEGCGQFRALKRCDENKLSCPVYVDRIFETFFVANKIALVNGIFDEDQGEKIGFKVNESGFNIQDYLFEKAGILTALGMTIAALVL